VAWDNSSGHFPTWATASAAWLAGCIAAGHSAPFNVSAIGGTNNAPPNLNNFQPITSFNLYGGMSGPTNQIVVEGSNATFMVTAPTPPFNYQWRFNSTNLAGATTNPLILTNVTCTNCGSYSVVVCNSCSLLVTSMPALLTVCRDCGLRAQDGNGVVKFACIHPCCQTNWPFRIDSLGTNYGIMLVPTDSPDASKFRIQTSSGVKALMKLPE